jgi:predicted Zn-dependent protease
LRRLALSAATALVASGSFASAASDEAPPVGYQPELKSDEAGLWMQAAQDENNVKTSPLLVKDPALNAYVHNIVCKIAAARCAELRIYIVQVPIFNAYSMPNGAFVVWTGLLLRAENEAQLAMMLGHELTHYFKRHSLARFQSVRDTGNVMAFIGLGGLFALPVLLIAGSELVSYTRDQEREADAGGFDLATAAGYDPTQAGAIWKMMSVEDKADPHKPGGGIFGHDHPSDEERLKTLTKRGAELQASRADWVVNADAYRAQTISYRTVWLEDEITRGNAWESVAVLERLSTNEPQSGLLRYYLGKAYRKRAQEGDLARATASYNLAITLPDAPAAAWRDLGLMAMKSGDKDGARADFANYLTHAPKADDRAMIEYYVAGLDGK